jgi:pimeloyl-ACP methyl ester carboxylesterase
MMFQKLCSTLILVAFFASAVVTGCAPVTVQQTTLKQTYTDVRADVLTTGELSQMTQQVLRMQGVLSAAQEPARAFQDLEARSTRAPDDDQQVALAELALLNAMHNETSNPTSAADWYVLAAARSYDFLFAKTPGNPLFDLRYERMRFFYLRALAGFLQQFKSTSGSFAAQQRTVFGQQYLMEIASGPGLFDPNTFDELLFAAEMNFEGLANRHRRFGLGLALVGFRKNTLAQPADRFYPKVGTAQTVTAVWRFEPAASGAQTARVARLYFYDAMQVDAIDFNGVQVPLAADFTAPFGLMISRGRLKDIGLSQTLSSADWLNEAGFYMTEPFDPHKIPIITVHGLLSSPITWINLQNDLMDDPVVRKHYQIWHFFYPAGLPILVSAQLFREKLEELYNFFDPHAQSPALQNAVVVAHSMGGLLTKTIVSDSGDQLWERTFQKPPTDLELSAALRGQLDRLLRFHREPFIKRVVFICVPHRGSLLAESFAGRIGRMLIAVPATVLAPVRLLIEQAGAALAPDVKEALQEDPTSIRGLSPQNPMIQALAGVAIAKGVPFHSIIGDRGLGDGEQGSDGVVPYKSSHLAGAESELIVPSDHAATAHPLTVLEVKRILRLHLQQASLPGS